MVHYTQCYHHWQQSWASSLSLIITTYFPKIHHNIILPSPHCSKWLYTKRFSTQNFCMFIVSSILTACPAHCSVEFGILTVGHLQFCSIVKMRNCLLNGVDQLKGVAVVKMCNVRVKIYSLLLYSIFCICYAWQRIFNFCCSAAAALDVGKG